MPTHTASPADAPTPEPVSFDVIRWTQEHLEVRARIPFEDLPLQELGDVIDEARNLGLPGTADVTIRQGDCCWLVTIMHDEYKAAEVKP